MNDNQPEPKSEKDEQGIFRPDPSRPIDPEGSTVNAKGDCSECSRHVDFRLDVARQDNDDRPYQWVHCRACDSDQKIYLDGEGFQSNQSEPGQTDFNA